MNKVSGEWAKIVNVVISDLQVLILMFLLLVLMCRPDALYMDMEKSEAKTMV